jgi:hypothetical protein
LQQQRNGAVTFTFTVAQPRLANELLLGPQANVPVEYTLLDEVRFPELNDAPYAKLYKIQHRAPPEPAPSGNVGE